MREKQVSLIAHKTVSPLLSPAVRCFSRVGSYWFNPVLKQRFPPPSCSTVTESGLVRDWSENAQRTTIFWAATAQSNLLVSTLFISSHIQRPLSTSWNRGMQPFTSFQWSGNRSSDVLHSLVKITWLFGEQKSNFCVHHFIVGQAEDSCPLATNNLRVELFLIPLLALSMWTSSV